MPVSYPAFDAAPCLDAIYAARRAIYPGSVVDDWSHETAEAIELGARMLGAAGTPAFFAYSQEPYSSPTEPLRYDPATPLDLARGVHEAIEALARVDLGATPPTRTARIRKAVSASSTRAPPSRSDSRNAAGVLDTPADRRRLPPS
jgi:hypothetical protein